MTRLTVEYRPQPPWRPRWWTRYLLELLPCFGVLAFAAAVVWWLVQIKAMRVGP